MGVIKNEKCYYCKHAGHSITFVNLNHEVFGTVQGRLCENCGHLGLFCGGSHSAHVPREINPVRLPEIIRNLKNK